MKNYNKINTIAGWVVFLIAAFVYLSTIEPTASFWDCGEFIAAGYKLEVGHPPGAPFFLLMTRIATLFAGGDTSKVPIMVNSMSALASAFTILFLFWTITHLARKIIIKDDSDYKSGNIIAIIASGIVGALAYTFSDTFWFSAVEGEVYATSSLFTALVFWAILKWENAADSPHANKWIVFIAYLMGLSIGVHLLNLLAIPAIVLVFYFKKYPFTTSGFIKALIISAVILGAVMYIIIPGYVKLAAAFDLLFVNSFGMHYWSGVFIFLIILFALLIWGIYSTYVHKRVVLNIILLSLTLIIIGYSSYATIVIRSLAEPPMDQNNPDNPFTLLSYLNREQYGDRPLFKGQYFDAQPESVDQGKAVYTPINGKYVVTTHKIEYKYNPEYETLFPRMWSSDPDHVSAYLTWAGIEEKDIYEPQRNNDGSVVRDNEGKVVYDRSKPKRSPTFSQNLRFFFRYQIGFMYLRYFMWNFSGRENDIQAHYKQEINKGNWISGIKFIDAARLGNQDELPRSMLENKARNKYYMLPLLLGILGLLYHYKKHQKDFWVVLSLFIMTGLAIVIYLNQNPIQPRERDYAYAGSFYAFAIWIGIGVLFVAEMLGRVMSKSASAIGAGIICTLAVPVIMGVENWDDHDRSGRYVARDFAYNYLNSTAPNAVLFTNGDNDTFPLWYDQEVEGIRTDVRVVNLSYLGADWYIHQMERKAYDSDPLPFSMDISKYIQGKRDLVYLLDMIDGYTDLKQAIDFVASDSPDTKRLPNYRENIDFIPNTRFFIPVDSSMVLENGTVSKKYASQIVPEVKFHINKRYVLKNHLMVLDLLANNNWKRPVYYAITVSSENYLNLEDYFEVQGLAYRIVPVKFPQDYQDIGGIDTDIDYENLINKFRWGGVNDPKTYLDENVVRMLTNFRNSFARLAQALIDEGKKDSAKIVLDKCLEIIPDSKVPYNIFNLSMIDAYFKIGEKQKAIEIAGILANNASDELDYLTSLGPGYQNYLNYEKRLNLHIINQLGQIYETYGEEGLSKEMDKKFQDYIMALNYTLR